jgi:U3 small nucleolar RNA-associated protein 24
MGASKKTRKFGAVKRIIGQRDARLARQDNRDTEEKKDAAEAVVRTVPQVSSSLFFQYNTALVPPYSVLVDTNFLSHTVQRKLPLLESMMDTLFAKCNPVITSCGQHSPPFSLHAYANTSMIKSWPSLRN